MSEKISKYNVNTFDTDFVDLGTIKLDLNGLEVAKVVANRGFKYGILFMKNGHSHVVEEDIIDKLSEYCR